MNKTDAKVYKALAEAGFEFGHEIPDPELDAVVKALSSKDGEKRFLGEVQDLFEITEDQIAKYARTATWEHRDIANATKRTKQAVRDKNNDALAKMLKHFNIQHSRKKVKDIIGKDVPSHQMGIVIGDKFINYQNSGFTGGQHVVDKARGLDLEQAFKYITDQSSKTKSIREQINKLLK